MLSLLLWSSLALAAEPPPGGWPAPPESSTVASVYDGDTLTLATGDKVRLRGVNTPELKPAEPYGIEARDAATAFLEGQTVHLLTGADARDGYGRIVAGIKTERGDLALHLLEKGLAHVFYIPPDESDLEAYLAAQARAKAANLGIWSTDRYRGALHITSFHANARGDDRENVNGEYLRVCNVSAGPLDLSTFRLTDVSERSYALPAISLPAGHTVEIHSGQGEHQGDPSQQIEVFLGSEYPIWNNDGDRASILDAAGAVVDARAHGSYR